MLQSLGRQSYYWAFTTYQGKKYLLGAFNSEREANDAAMRELGTFYTVVKLPTKDSSKAKQMLKAQFLEKTRNIDTSLQNISNKRRKH